jgi:hypothetical protein
MEEAHAEFLRHAKTFVLINDPFVHMDVGRPGIEWWRALEWLALSESRLKQAFCVSVLQLYILSSDSGSGRMRAGVNRRSRISNRRQP